jgi:hypothetical protein
MRENDAHVIADNASTGQELDDFGFTSVQAKRLDRKLVEGVEIDLLKTSLTHESKDQGIKSTYFGE